MIRKLAITVFAFLVSLLPFPGTRQPPTRQASSALHLMNNSEFALFLGRLNAAVLGWETQLEKFRREVSGPWRRRPRGPGEKLQPVFAIAG